MLKSKLASAIVYFNDEATVVQLNDFAVDMPSERTFKDSGAMVAPCTIARTGIMQYRASECGALFADREPNSIVKIATLEADLFDAESIESYRSAPITVNHPTEWVNTTNAKDLQKGNLDSIPFADSNMLAGNIVITDADTLKLIDEGTQQLSSGTSCTLVMADEGLEYDAYKTDIRANHIAIVETGRNGNAQIADEDIQLSDEEIKLADAKKALDEVTVQLADANKQIDTLTANLESTQEKLTVADTALTTAQGKLSDEAIDSLVAKRLVFVQSVATLTDTDITGMSELAAKTAVVAELLDKDMSDKSATYIECRFDILLEDGGDDNEMGNLLKNQVKQKLDDELKEPVSTATTSRQNMINRTQGIK